MQTTPSTRRDDARPCPDPRAYTYTLDGAQGLTGLGRTTLYVLMREGKLRRIKIGRRTLIDAASLRDLLGVAA